MLPRIALAAILLVVISSVCRAGLYPDRFVWVFGWNLNSDADTEAVVKVLDTAGKSGLNGAVLSIGLDYLSKQPPEYLRRLDVVKKACERNKLEIIPAVFSVGYGSALGFDGNLAEGIPVTDAPFAVAGDRARFEPDPTVRIPNGGFEEHDGNTLKRFEFHDQPGVISFVDTQIKHGGAASLRLENFTANQYGHGRVMSVVKVKPHRCYRVSIWARTEGLGPASSFQMLALAKDRELAPRKFSLPATSDWQKLAYLVNSLDNYTINLYAGIWGGKTGKLWLDDWSIEEVGPLNVLHRPGTPVTVRSEDGKTVYTEGTDYAPLVDPNSAFNRIDRPWTDLRLVSGSRIRNGQRLLVSWYHAMTIYDGQVTVCMAELRLYEIMDREARLIAQYLHPRRYLLEMDEIRMGGTCKACERKDMGALLGECITKEVAILRKHSSGAQVYCWSDMLDPNHNAHGDYYLVKGSFANSWTHVPKDLIMAVWGGEPRAKSLQFFAGLGFSTMVACYYDADTLDEVKGWIDAAKGIPGVRGFMYTPWERKYGLLGEFGKLVAAATRP